VLSRAGLAALLVGITFIVYLPVLGHEFVSYDDYEDVIDNPLVRAGLSASSAMETFSTPSNRAHWFPMTTISLQIDFELWGPQPAGYHLTNVVLHTLAALMLFLAFTRMTGSPGKAGFVAAVFAVHPLHVESVAWAAERKDVLSGLFWMLALYTYALYAERPQSRLRYAALLLWTCLGLLSKPIVVTLPFALLLLDYWPLGRLRRGPGRWLPEPASWRRPLLEKLPMWVLAACSSALTFALQRAAGAMGHLDGLTFDLRLANAIHSTAIYVLDSFWPRGLAVLYPHPVASLSLAEVAASAVFLLAVTLAVARCAASRPYAVVGWLWFLITLVPVIGLVQVGLQARADRYMYLPLIGLSLIVAWGAADLGSRWRWGGLALRAAAIAVVTGLTLAAATQVSYWRDSIALYERAIAVTENNAIMHGHLAAALLERDRVFEAEHHAREAIRIAPDDVRSHIRMAEVLAARGDLDGLIRRYERILRMETSFSAVDLVHSNLGFALIRAGRFAEARPHLERTLSSDFQNAHNFVGMALIAAANGQMAEAARFYRDALALDPDMRFAANGLARILATAGSAELRDPEGAIRVAEAALLDCGGSDPVLLHTLAIAYEAAGRPQEAARARARAAEAAKAAGFEVVPSSYPIDQLFLDIKAPLWRR
jgi:tetratricopeptide (TPR) repeat protein